MSDSVRPLRRQPTRLPVPGILQARTLEWVAPSFSNACMHAKSLQSCPALCDPMDCSPPGSSVHGVLQARVLEWGAIAFLINTFSDIEQQAVQDHDSWECGNEWDMPYNQPALWYQEREPRHGGHLIKRRRQKSEFRETKAGICGAEDWRLEFLELTKQLPELTWVLTCQIGQYWTPKTFNRDPRRYILVVRLPFSSVQSLSRAWLCDSMDFSTPGFHVHHQLPELTQTQTLSQGYSGPP